MNQEQGYKFCPLDPNGGDCVCSCAWNVSMITGTCVCAISSIAKSLNRNNIGVILIDAE